MKEIKKERLMLSACKKLIAEWENEEDIELQRGSAYHLGIGTGYGICREELKEIVSLFEKDGSD